MTETTEGGKGKGQRHLILFLVPLCLALAGNAGALFFSSTEWGANHVRELFLATLVSWAAASFLMWRAYTNSGASGEKVQFSLFGTFAFITGALCALDTSSGFIFFEGLFGAAIIASYCIEASGFVFTHIPRSILWMAGVQTSCIVVALMVSDLRLSVLGASVAFMSMLLLLFSGEDRTNSDRTE